VPHIDSVEGLTKGIIMAYVLRFTQHYKPANRRAFLDIESKFSNLEQRSLNLPRGRRSQPVAGGEPTHSIVWECEFGSWEDIQQALTQLAEDPAHTDLFEQQSPYITGLRTEIFEILEF
jgi:hypothetical protein